MNVSDFICNNIEAVKENITNFTNEIKNYTTRNRTYEEFNENQDYMQIKYDDDSTSLSNSFTSSRKKRNISNLRINIPKYTDDLRHRVRNEISNFERSSSSYFKHLDFAGQTYWEHFKASMGYSWKSVKCSFFFFVHAIWPNFFQTQGSEIINDLSDEFVEKYEQRLLQIRRGQV